jgi:hypothetical protein
VSFLYNRRGQLVYRLGLLLLGAALAGCGRDDVAVYRVAKEQPQTQAQQPTGMMPATPETGAPSLKWRTPAGWEEVAPGQMRAASFRVKGEGGKQADVGVFPLPGMAGSDLDNVNRWRGQVGQAPITGDELTKLAQSVEIGGESGQLYEPVGESPGSGDKTRILAAILRREGVAWFFKMTGDDGLVASQKPAFIEFLKSVSFSPATAQGELPPSHPPIGGADMMAALGTGSGASANLAKPNWQVPAGWQEVPGGPFLVAKFTVAGADHTEAAVNVSRAAGTGGGVVGNVNRWRGQLGLGQLSEGEIDKLVTPMDTSGGKAIMIELSGTDPRTGQKTRLVGVILPEAGQTWFYKLMGSESLVGREKDAFAKFVQTAKN